MLWPDESGTTHCQTKISSERPLTDLYDNDQEEGHISCEVDLMDLEHWGTQTKNQSPNNDLDRLEKDEEWKAGRRGDQIH